MTKFGFNTRVVASAVRNARDDDRNDGGEVAPFFNDDGPGRSRRRQHAAGGPATKPLTPVRRRQR